MVTVRNQKEEKLAGERRGSARGTRIPELLAQRQIYDGPSGLQGVGSVPGSERLGGRGVTGLEVGGDGQPQLQGFGLKLA